MQFELATIKNAGIAAYQALFAGRIARTTFAIRVAILVAAVGIMLSPLETFLAPSSKTLKDAYIALSLAMLVVCVVGFASAYVKRLHDMGLRGYWAILFIVALPYLLIQAGYAYTNYRYLQDNTADLSGVYDFLFAVPLALPLLIAMWRGEKGDNRFGPVPDPVEHVGASKFNIAAVVGAAAILIPTCIYAGLFQSGVWVGRGNMPSAMPLIDSNRSGYRFMKCWNVKGVGAGSGEGPLSGVFRDGYEGMVFDFYVTEDGQIDIASAGKTVSKSYLDDGFRIIPYGLQLPAEGSGVLSVRDLDRFMLVAIYDQGGTSEVVNYTTFAFGRGNGHWPDYNFVMTSALSAPVDPADLAKFPPARAKLMIGDCVAS